MKSELFSYLKGLVTLISLRLNKLLGDVVISQGGVVPFINPELLPSKSRYATCCMFIYLDLMSFIAKARRRVQAKRRRFPCILPLFSFYTLSLLHSSFL
jgi:hypothetical protein